MKVLFSIEFTYKNRVYCGIVRINEGYHYTAYNVRIMNNRLDNCLYGHHEFRTEAGQLPYIASGAGERTETLRQAVYDGLSAWLQTREVAIPPQKGWRESNHPYYVHNIRP